MPARTRGTRPTSRTHRVAPSARECIAHATPPSRGRMHPADLATHRAQRARAERRAFERDLARLLLRVDTAERVRLNGIAHLARTGDIAMADAHALLRHRQSQLDQQQAA